MSLIHWSPDMVLFMWTMFPISCTDTVFTEMKYTAPVGAESHHSGT